MRILILAAGYGTRLYPLTVDKPKAFIDVKGEVLIDLIWNKIRALRSQYNIEEVVLVTNNKFYSLFQQWTEQNELPVKVLNDGSDNAQNKLGAIADMHFGIKNSKRDDWLILGSDNFFDWELDEFISFAQKKRPSPSLGLYKLNDIKEGQKFGVVTLGKDNKIDNFIEKPQDPPVDTVATCIYFLPVDSLLYLEEFLKRQHTKDSLGNYIEWLISKVDVYGYEFCGTWVDVGSKDSLKKVG
jgi:glucose-1-phosphate thymidylyltransferase